MSSTTMIRPLSGITADGLETPRRYWAIMAIWLATSMSVMDGAIANLALPEIARAMNATPAMSIGVINAYQVAIMIALMPLAAAGEILGYRWVYLAGLGLFSVGALACTLATNLPMLIVTRALQGIGAAGIMSMNAALVRFTYPSRMLGSGLGFNALVIAVSAALGPTIGALILSALTWRWVFAFSVPFALLSIIVGSLSLPRTPGPPRASDWSAVLKC